MPCAALSHDFSSLRWQPRVFHAAESPNEETAARSCNDEEKKRKEEHTLRSTERDSYGGLNVGAVRGNKLCLAQVELRSCMRHGSNRDVFKKRGDP